MEKIRELGTVIKTAGISTRYLLNEKEEEIKMATTMGGRIEIDLKKTVKDFTKDHYRTMSKVFFDIKDLCRWFQWHGVKYTDGELSRTLETLLYEKWLGIIIDTGEDNEDIYNADLYFSIAPDVYEKIDKR